MNDDRLKNKILKLTFSGPENRLGVLIPEISTTPFFVDFEGGKLAHRSAKSLQQRELIVRACAIKSLDRPLKILDATAGFGRDGFMLAVSGAEVTLIERNPTIFALLADGLAHIQDADLSQRLKLIQKDAKKILTDLASSPTKPDVIYLDPMFQVKRQAKVKKDLQILQAILEKDAQDQNELLPLALKAANYRVVVKRAIQAEALDHIAPSFSLKGKHSRFDVYQISPY